MKLLTAIFLLSIFSFSMFASASTECTISKRNGGFVIEEQTRSRKIVETHFDKNLNQTLDELTLLIDRGECLSPKAEKCELSERNGGFVVQGEKRGLKSSFNKQPSESVIDLVALVEAKVCSKNSRSRGCRV